MADKLNKLELTWIGKEIRPRLEPRILLEQFEHSYRTPVAVSERDLFENMLIHGDNLLGLKALEQRFAGKFKCVAIDPPYNTGSAFGVYYDDGVEHSIWLSLMRDRIEVIHRLLSQDGSLWMFLDDNEVHYMKVVCDEIFGRHNFVQTVVWQRKASPANDAKWLSNDHDYLLVFAKSKETWRPRRLTRNADQNAYYTNPDNDSRGPWNSVTYTCNKSAEERPGLYYAITNPNTGEAVWPKRTAVWRCGQETHSKNVKNKLVYWGKDGRGQPRLKRFLDAAKPVVPRSVWLHDDVGHTQGAMTESKVLFPQAPFPTPKTEAVMERVLQIASAPGDWVLDSFAGSGTTGAVAHKLGRRWVMIEVHGHALTHCAPRLRKVIDGDDAGGVTEAAGWDGGGGFHFYRLAPSLLERDKWGNWVVNKSYNKEMLAEAMCKLEGFTYAPSTEHFWMHGQSTERDHLYVTTQTLAHDNLAAISDEVGPERTLLICCGAFVGKADQFANLTLKKIPAAVLARCEWDKDDYSLNVANVTGQDPDDAATISPASGSEVPVKRRKKAASVQEMALFAAPRGAK